MATPDNFQGIKLQSKGHFIKHVRIEISINIYVLILLGNISLRINHE